jgi:hypothetical protein
MTLSQKEKWTKVLCQIISEYVPIETINDQIIVEIDDH